MKKSTITVRLVVHRGDSHLNFHVATNDEDYIYPHDHDVLEFAYLEKGAVMHYFGDEAKRIEAGEYFFVDHGMVHWMERVSEEPYRIINFLFAPDFIDRTLAGKDSFSDILSCYLLKYCYHPTTQNFANKIFNDDGTVKALIDDIILEYTEKKYGYVEWIRSQFIKIMLAALRQLEPNTDTETYDELTEPIVARIKEQYARPLRLKEIAAEMGYSAEYLSARFSKSVGQSFSSYLQQIRLEQACLLLETTDLPVAEIARSVGINDIKFFHSIFKSHLNITPGGFRKLYK